MQSFPRPRAGIYLRAHSWSTPGPPVPACRAYLGPAPNPESGACGGRWHRPPAHARGGPPVFLLRHAGSPFFRRREARSRATVPSTSPPSATDRANDAMKLAS